MKKKLLIVIPYRGRPEQLATLLPHLHWYLDGLDFEIAVIEQGDSRKFNKGLLFNAGFQLFHRRFDYFVFHDVDLIPVEADYSYPKTPVHLGTRLSQYGYQNIYPGHLHGVVMFNKIDFKKINGFSLIYRGWGIEDQDLLLRCEKAGLQILRREGRFVSLPHQFKNSQIFDSIKNWRRLEKIRRQEILSHGIDQLKFKVLSRQRTKAVELFVPMMKKKMKIQAPHHHIVITQAHIRKRESL